MNNYNVGDVFIYDNEYSKRAQWCNENGKIIKEIEPSENGERRFQIQQISQPTQKELAQQELTELKEWYDIEYARKEQKYRRLHTLGKLTDEDKDPYNELINLYNEAEIKRARIQELERLSSDSSK